MSVSNEGWGSRRPLVHQSHESELAAAGLDVVSLC